MSDDLQFRYDCDGLIDAVKRAAAPSDSDFSAYLGSKTEYAVLFAKLVMRRARKLGLYQDERVFPTVTRKAS
jgi:hypothetical protein